MGDEKQVEYEVDGDAHVGKKLVKRFNGRPYLGQVVHVVLLSYHKVFFTGGEVSGKAETKHSYAPTHIRMRPALCI